MSKPTERREIERRYFWRRLPFVVVDYARTIFYVWPQVLWHIARGARYRRIDFSE